MSHYKSADQAINDVLLGASLGLPLPKGAEDTAKKVGANVASAFLNAITGRVPENRNDKKYLPASSIGKPCQRQIWYGQRAKDYPSETLLPAAKFKFLFGDVIEELALGLAELGGCEVEGQQAPIDFPIGDTGWKVLGRIDAMIDGKVVDVKSASVYGLKKFETEDGLKADDPFGYIDQLSVYEMVLGKKEEPPEFLVVGKEMGHVKSLPIHEPTPKKVLENRLIKMVEMVEKDTPPARGFDDVADGKSGNRKLCTTCSYCGYKGYCWEGYRTFLYSNKPVYLTTVKKLPKVPELK